MHVTLTPGRPRLVGLSAATLVALSATAALADAPSGDAQIGCWNFDEGAGLVANDGSGLGHTGKLVNGASFTAAGRNGFGLAVDGVNDRVDVAYKADLNLWKDLTIMAWVRPTASSGWRTVLQRTRTGGLNYGLYAFDDGAGPSGYVHVGTDVGAVGGTRIPLNEWTHLATTYDGSALRVYVNGALAASRAESRHLFDSTKGLSIGGNTAASREYFAGTIDEVCLYGRALTPAELLAAATVACAPAACDDGDGCTVDSCDASGACTHTPYVCDAGFACEDAGGEPVCANIDDCAAQPCQNGGVCVDGIEAYTCVCAEGYDGTDCEHLMNACERIRANDPDAADGDYAISLSGRTVTIYCHDMAGSPREYLTLVNTGAGQNFAQYTSGTSVRTSYTKVRLDTATLLVDIGDQLFSSSSGQLNHGSESVTSMPYGVAMDCSGGTPTGAANVDLRGTPFRTTNTWSTGGFIASGSATKSSDDQVVDVVGGGFCGWTSPVGLFNPFNNRGGFVLQLELLPICTPNPCQNGGTCNDGGDSYTCSCPVGWAGASCEIEAPVCQEYVGTQCFWMETSSGNFCFVPASWATTYEACRAQDSCSTGGGHQSGGGCYKWADCTSCPATPW